MSLPHIIYETCPPGYYSASPPADESDTGWYLFFVLAPAFILLGFVIPIAVNYADGTSVMTDKQICWSVTAVYSTLMCFALAVGLTLVHTPREEMVEYYNQVAADWTQRGGEQNMRTCADFSLFTSIYNAHTIIPIRRLNRMDVGAREGATGENDVTNSDSYYWTTVLNKNDTRNGYEFSDLEHMYVFGARLRVNESDPNDNNNNNGGGGSKSQSSSTSSSASTSDSGSGSSSSDSSNIVVSNWVNTSIPPSMFPIPVKRAIQTLSCNSNFCTSSCSTKQRSKYGTCSASSSSPIQNFCRAQNGVWTPKVPNATSCSYGNTCGTCAFTEYLTKVCFWVLRSGNSFSLSSQYGGCEYPFSKKSDFSAPGIGLLYTAAGGNSKIEIPTTIEIIVRNVVDPYLGLALVTQNTFDFGISTEAKYRKPALGMWVAFVVLFFGTWFFLASKLGWWFFGLTRVRSNAVNPRHQNTCCDCDNSDDDDDAGGINNNENDARFRAAQERQSLLRNNQNQNTHHQRTYSSTSSIAQEILCQVCYAALRNRKFLPCRHHFACEDCTQRLIAGAQPCPLCRQPIQSSEYCRPEDPTFAVFVDDRDDDRHQQPREGDALRIVTQNNIDYYYDSSDDEYYPVAQTNTANRVPVQSTTITTTATVTRSINDIDEDEDDVPATANQSSNIPIGPLPRAAVSSASSNSSASSSASRTTLICAICLENRRTRRFRPCGHKVCCAECAPMFVNRPCPLCRTNVERHTPCLASAPTYVRFSRENS